MKRRASIDAVALAILRASYEERLREPNKCMAKPAREILKIALSELRTKFDVRNEEWRGGQNKLEITQCFERYTTFDGKGEINHMRLTPAGERLMKNLSANDKTLVQESISSFHWRVTFLITLAGLVATAIIFIYKLLRES
jgi:hypothetical protein